MTCRSRQVATDICRSCGERVVCRGVFVDRHRSGARCCDGSGEVGTDTLEALRAALYEAGVLP